MSCSIELACQDPVVRCGSQTETWPPSIGDRLQIARWVRICLSQCHLWTRGITRDLVRGVTAWRKPFSNQVEGSEYPVTVGWWRTAYWLTLEHTTLGRLQDYYLDHRLYVGSVAIVVYTCQHYEQAVGGRPPQCAPAPLLPLWAPKRLVLPSRPRLQSAT